MDEEEIEGLLPRTDLDNASQPSVSAEEVMLGGAGLGSIGFFNQTGRMPSPVVNTSSPVAPTFQPPAVQGPTTPVTTQPTTLTTTRPTTLTTTRPTTLTNVPRATPNYNVNYGGAAAGGARLLGAAGLKGAAAFGAGYGIGTGINQVSQFSPGMDGEKISDKLARAIAPDVFQNAEAIDKSMQLQADFRNETARLKAIEAEAAARQKEISDLIGSIPGEMALEKMRQDGPKNLQEAYEASGVMGPGIAPQYGQASDAEILAQREARAAADKQRMFDVGSQFEAAYQKPDGTFEGRLSDGTKRRMTPEELEAMEYAQTVGDPSRGQPPLGEYQAVPGTDGFVRLPMAPAPAPAPLIGSSPQVAPAPVTTPAVAPAPIGLIGTGTETNFTPEEISLINNNPFLPPEMRPASDVTSVAGGAPIVAEIPSADKTNLRPITTADANNPAFEGMSASEIVEAVNAPGYRSPDSVAMPTGSLPTSRFERISDDVAEMTGMAGDVLYGTGKLLVSPAILAKNYFLGTEDNKNPTFREAASETFDTVAATPISDFMSGETAAQSPNEVFAAQDARNAEFLNREATPAMVTEQAFNPGQVTQELTSTPEAVPQSLPPATINNYRDRGMTLSQFMRYEDEPSRRTEQFVDAQGRIRRRLTPNAARLQGFSEKEIGQGSQLAPEYAFYEKEAAARNARIEGGDRLPGETQTERDTRIANSKTERDTSAANSRTSGGIRDKQLGYSDGDLRKIFGGGDALQRAKALAQNGIDPTTGNQAIIDDLNQRILESEAEAAEKGDDPNDKKTKKLRALMLEEQLAQLRKKGLPQEITFELGEQGTVIVKKNGSDIGYFKQDRDAAAEMTKLGYDIMGANKAGSGSNNIPQAAIDLLKKDPSTRDYFDKTFGAGSSDKFLPEGSTKD